MDIRKHKKGLYFIVLGTVLVGALLVVFRRTDLFSFIKLPFEYTLKSIIWLIIHTLGLSDINPNAFNSSIYLTADTLLSFNIEYLMKKWLFFPIIIVLLTPINQKRKLISALSIIPIHYVSIYFKFLIIIFLYNKGFGQYDGKSVSSAIVYLIYLLLISFWIRTNPGIYEKIANLTKYPQKFIVKKVKELVILLYVLVALKVTIALFQFEPWIQFLFNTSSYILSLFNYQSCVDGLYLFGEKCSIYMEKGCLGIQTTFIFGAFVYLTGVNIRNKLLYIISGIIIINIANILRFVFLFMHLHNYGSYIWNIEVHDMFNLLVYSIVLILWIIWIEKFTDLWKYLRIKDK